MNPLHSLGILCAVLAVSSCAVVRPNFQEVQVPPERISQKGYSITPLNEKGWFIVGRNPDQLDLLRYGEDPDESFAIVAGLLKLPVFKTAEEFVHLVKEFDLKGLNPNRFKVMKHDVTAYTGKGAVCARSYIVAEDHVAVRWSGKTGHMVLEMQGLTCAHPKDKTVGVNVGYSQRYYVQRDPDFLKKATNLLNSIEFNDF